MKCGFSLGNSFICRDVGLKNGRVQTIMGYVLTAKNVYSLRGGRRVVFGYSTALADLYHGAREKF